MDLSRKGGPEQLDYVRFQAIVEVHKALEGYSRGIYGIGETLAEKFGRQWKLEGSVELKGSKVKTIHDLALVAQVFRNRQFEVQHWVFVKNGEVVGQQGLTARIPDATPYSTRPTRRT